MVIVEGYVREVEGGEGTRGEFGFLGGLYSGGACYFDGCLGFPVVNLLSILYCHFCALMLCEGEREELWEMKKMEKSLDIYAEAGNGVMINRC